MKNKILLLTILCIGLFGLKSCEDTDNFRLQAPETIEELTITNGLLTEYLLIQETFPNVAERFTWDSPDFGVQSNVTYDLEYSADGLFDNPILIGSTSENQISVTVQQLWNLAQENLGLEPNTANDSGELFFRIKADLGSPEAENSPASVSAVQILNVKLIQTTAGSGIMPASWGVVGSGYNDWGNGGPDGQFYTTNQPDVFVAYVTLIDGAIKFREDNLWANNFGDDGADGTLEAGGADINVTAGNYRITLDLANNTYTMEEWSWGVVGSAYNNWGSDGPDAKFYYDYTTDTFKVGVKLLDGEMKFRLNNDWGNNFGDTGADGTLDNGGDNIQVTAGYYTITLNFNDNTYTLEADDVWGVVGSGYNDWGNAGDDFALTEINPDIFYGDIVTLVDGLIKFRVNNDWGNNLGDDGTDGTFESGGADIPVTAGLYRIMIDAVNGTYSLNKIQ